VSPSHLQDDETATVAAIGRLPPRFRALFALLAALRILPAYRRFHEKTGRGDADKLESTAERLWRDLAESAMTNRELKSALRATEKLIPQEGEGWDETLPNAEDAATALAYALDARIKGSPQDAAGAADRAIEVSYRFAVASIAGDSDVFPKHDVTLSHPVVQAELRRQQRDLRQLAVLAQEEAPQSRFAELWKRSEREAKTFFDPHS
jgi:hypothetical protein